MPKQKSDLPIGVTDDGHFNHLPMPIRQARADEFWGGVPFDRAAEYRQITNPKQIPGYPHGYHASCYIFWMANGAWLVIPPTKWSLTDNQEVKYDESPLFYWIGCDHDDASCRNLSRCYNEYTCKLCGYKWRIDSSD